MPIIGGRQASVRGLGFQGAGAPAQVTGLSATNVGSGRAFNNGRIDLAWTAPATNGAPITGYFIERSTDGTNYSTLVANTGNSNVSYSDTGLTSAQQYWYRISAINAVGTGLVSTAANATATTVPQAPTVSAANVGTGRAFNNGAATITVSGGATGGSTITSYTATSSPGSFTATSGSPLTVTGLQSATAYTFSVTATNANGTSTATVSNSITATTVPQAPTIGTATAGNTQATITFTAGATGGSAITTFTSTSSPAAGSGSSASSPITHTGLSNGTAYTFTVTATNANGTSAASAASNSVTPVSPSGTNWTTTTPTVSGTGAQYTQPFIYSAAAISNSWQVAGATNNGYDMSAWGNGTSGNPPTSWTYTMGPLTNGGTAKLNATSNGFVVRSNNAGSNWYSYTTSPGQNANSWTQSAVTLSSIGSASGFLRHDSSLGQYVRAFVYNGVDPWFEAWSSHTSGSSTTYQVSGLSLPSGASWSTSGYFGSFYYNVTNGGTSENRLFYRSGLATTGWTQVTLPSGSSVKFIASSNAAAVFRFGQTAYNYTTNGTTWQSGTLPTTYTSTPVIDWWASPRIFIAGGNGTVYHTTDGATWTATNLASSIINAGSSFVYNSTSDRFSASPSQLANASSVAQTWYTSNN